MEADTQICLWKDIFKHVPDLKFYTHTFIYAQCVYVLNFMYIYFLKGTCKANWVSNLRWKASAAFKDQIEKMGEKEAKKRTFI